MARRTVVRCLGAAGLAAVVGAAARPATAGAVGEAPSVLELPPGFQPEGIAIGEAPYAYVGSLVDGSVYRADLRTGQGRIINSGTGTTATGMKADWRGRLFVCDGLAGSVRVLHAGTGRELARHQLAEEGGFVNDMLLTPGAAWFTDSFRPFLYRLPAAGPDHTPRALPLTGDIVYQDGYNSNGIVTTPDGRALLLVQANTGLLFRVDPNTGVTRTVDLGGDLLPNGDGLLRQGRTLYAVHDNSLGVLMVNRDGTKAWLVERITDPRLDWPATVAAFGGRLYLTNARWSTPVEPTTRYTVVALPSRL